MVQRYLNKAILYDAIIALVFCSILFVTTNLLKWNIKFPTSNSGLQGSLIAVSATLIGFLLTIITVIITFKKGFDKKSENATEKTIDTENGTLTKTVFDKKPKEEQFYGTDLFKWVANHFVSAAIELGFVLALLLLLEYIGLYISSLLLALSILFSAIIIILSLLRCLRIFRLYLNVHLS